MVRPLHTLVNKTATGKHLQWTPATEQAFHTTRQSIADCQTLYWVRDDLPLFLHTDASDGGIGAYLFQVDSNGKEWPVHFLSQTFSDVQTRWSTMEKECYAIYHSLRKLEHVLRDRPFVLRTDHRNLLFLNSQPSSKVTRWKLAIQEYDFQIEHIPGKDNIVADKFSRLCNATKGQHDNYAPSRTVVVNTQVCSVSTTPLCQACTPGPTPTPQTASPSVAALPSAASHVSAPASDQSYPAALGTATPDPSLSETASPINESRAQATGPDPDVYRIPNTAFSIIKQCHHASTGDGHSGVDRTLAAVRLYLEKTSKPTWDTLQRDVTEYVKRCPCCQRQSLRRPPLATAPYVLSNKDMAMRHIAIDTLGPFPADELGNTYLVAIIDCFSRYVELTPAADATADAAARAITGHFQHFGVPKTIRSDNGSQYANATMAHLSRITGTDFTKTIPYSHEENGLIERAHREVLHHLRSIYTNGAP